jgi:hypothetical protein
LTALVEAEERRLLEEGHCLAYPKENKCTGERVTRRLKMGVTSNFSRYIRTVDGSKEGPLWELKSEMTI